MHLNFRDSEQHTWETFAKLLKIAGADCAHHETLWVVTANSTVFVGPGKTVSIDLQRRGRFATVGAGLRFFGPGKFIVRNGLAVDKAGGIFISGGDLHVSSAHVIFEDCEADFAGGLYQLSGSITIDADASFPDVSGALSAVRCRASKRAGGGISIWEGLVNLTSQDATIFVTNCTTPWHGGGFIVFLGTVRLSGAAARIVAQSCRSGKEAGSLTSYGSGIQIGQNFPGQLIGSQSAIEFLGENACVEAHDCSSVGAVGVAFIRTRITTRQAEGVPQVFAGNNIMRTSKIRPIQPICVVLVRRCKGDSIIARIDGAQCDYPPCTLIKTVGLIGPRVTLG
jgi:hypothetical protein